MAEQVAATGVAAWVDGHAQELVEFVQELVRAGRPAAAGEPPRVEEAQALVAGRAAAFGLGVTRRIVDTDAIRSHPGFLEPGIDPEDRPYVVATVRGSGGRRSLVLNGHVDVVPAGDESRWARPPYSGDVVDGRLHGRGAVDAKGPLAALLYGLAGAREVAAGELGDLTLVSVGDEESGGMGTLASLLAGDTGDAVLVGEPTGLGLAPAARGATGFRLTLRGRQAHAGAAFEGVNAISKAAALVAAIEELQRRLDRERPNELYGQLPVAHAFNVGTIHGGDFTGVVPDACTLAGVAPAIGDETVDDAKASLREAVEAFAAGDPWLAEHPPVLEWTAPCFEPSHTPLDHELVRTAASAVARELGRPPAIGPLLAGSDLRFYTRYHRIPGLHVGPGALRLAHGTNEALPVHELLAGARAVAAIILDWSGGTAT